MKYFIITGTSRGLGEALVKQLIDKDSTIFCISKTTENENELLEIADQNRSKLVYFKKDLIEVEQIDELMNDVFSRIKSEDLEGIYLINNASILAPIKKVGDSSDNEVKTNITVNLIAPMRLTSEFIRRTEKFSSEKRVINLSSGAGKKPYYGWSSYCSAKAGLDMFTRCSALEEESKEYPVEILSFAPGVIDTEMQAEIRASNKEDFIQLERFIAFKEDGILLPPSVVAQTIIELLLSNEFEQGGIVDIKDFLKK